MISFPKSGLSSSNRELMMVADVFEFDLAEKFQDCKFHKQFLGLLYASKSLELILPSCKMIRDVPWPPADV